MVLVPVLELVATELPQGSNKLYHSGTHFVNPAFRRRLDRRASGPEIYLKLQVVDERVAGPLGDKQNVNGD
jgi:hypothetical protein